MIDEQSMRSAIEAFGSNAGRLVELTLLDADRLVEDIGRALTEQDAEAAGKAGHSLKSVMRQIEASSVADLAASIEASGKGGSLDDCSAHFAQLQAAFSETKGLLQSYI